MLGVFYRAWRAQDLRHWFREMGFLLYCTIGGAISIYVRFLFP